MEEFWISIFVLFFVINSMEKAESVRLFDEIFGEGWWDNEKADEWDKLTLEQNFHHQIDRQNTQIEQIEPNSTDQNPPLTESDHLGQIEHNSTDQNPPLTESDHSDNATNGEEHNEIKQKITSNENIAEDEQKRKIIDKFHAIKDELKQKGKFHRKERNQIDSKIAKHLKVSRSKIYEWKKEFGISRKPGSNYSDDEKLRIAKKLMQMKSERSGEDIKSCKEIDKEIAESFGVNVRTINQWKKKFGLSRTNSINGRKNLIEKFDQMKAELKRDGFKNSYHQEIDKTVAKELGLNFETIYRWKNELGQTKPQNNHNEQKELMKVYYEIKGKNPKMSVRDIAKILNIGRDTLYIWKRQFKRQQMHPNFENIGPERLFG